MSTLNEQMQALSLPTPTATSELDQLRAMLLQQQAELQQAQQTILQQQRQLNPFQYDVSPEELDAAQQVDNDLKILQTVINRLLRRGEGDMGMFVDPDFVLPRQPTVEGVLAMVKVSSNIYQDKWHKPLAQFTRRTLPGLTKAAKSLRTRRHQTASTDNKVRLMARDHAKDQKARADLARQRQISQNRAMGRGAAEEDDTPLPPSSIPARSVPLQGALRSMVEEEAVEDDESVENDVDTRHDDVALGPYC